MASPSRRCIHLGGTGCQKRYTESVRALPGDLVRKLQNRGQDLTVLVLRMGAFGDVLRTLPAVRAARSHLSAARILWIVDERWATILQGHPDLDGVVPLPRSTWRRMSHSPSGFLKLGPSVLRWIREIRSLRADLALDFHGNLRSGWLGFLSGARVRLGYAGHQQKEGNWLFTTHRVAAGARRTSRVERNLSLVRALGVPATVSLPDTGLPITMSDVRVARELVAKVVGDRPYAVVSPGASRKQAYKKPPTHLLAAAIERLAFRGTAVLVVYGPGEEADAEALVQTAHGAASLSPPTDLRVLAALLRRARMFVGGDSGPLHLACSVGCPVLGMYGPTDPEVNPPWGVPFVALQPVGRTYTGIKKRDRASGGFEGIEPRAVHTAVDDLFVLAERCNPQSSRAL